MSRPYTDIVRIDNTKGINNKTAVCSTLPTGKSSTRVIRPNFPGDLTIENVQQKFGNRFYNGIFVQLAGGQTIIGG
jgi:hypothetical protein